MSRKRERGGVIGVILLVLVAAGIVAVVAAVSVTYWISRHTRVTESAGDTRVETPFGSVRVRERRDLDPGRVGLPVYPGAARVEDKHKLASFELDLGDEHKQFSVAVAEFTTPDSVSTVMDWYRRKLPDWTVEHRRHGGVQIEMRGGGARKLVAVRERHGQTHIALASVGEPASN